MRNIKLEIWTLRDDEMFLYLVQTYENLKAVPTWRRHTVFVSSILLTLIDLKEY